MTEKLYPDVRPWEVEPFYSRHVSAMTTEALHSKADIARQLAWRDQRIAELETRVDVDQARKANASLVRALHASRGRQIELEAELATLRAERDDLRGQVQDYETVGVEWCSREDRKKLAALEQAIADATVDEPLTKAMCAIARLESEKAELQSRLDEREAAFTKGVGDCGAAIKDLKQDSRAAHETWNAMCEELRIERDSLRAELLAKVALLQTIRENLDAPDHTDEELPNRAFVARKSWVEYHQQYERLLAVMKRG